MAPSNLGYSTKEAFRHFFRNWTTSFGAVITIFLSLFIIGLFIVGSVLVNSAIGNVEDQVTIQAYISDDPPMKPSRPIRTNSSAWTTSRTSSS